MTHKQMQLVWCLAFTMASGVLAGIGANWWIGASVSMSLFSIHNMMLARDERV